MKKVFPKALKFSIRNFDSLDYKSILLRGRSSLKGFEITKIDIIKDRVRFLVKSIFILLKFLKWLFSSKSRIIPVESLVVNLDGTVSTNQTVLEYIKSYHKNMSEFVVINSIKQSWIKKKAGVKKIFGLVFKMLMMSMLSFFDFQKIRLDWIANSYDFFISILISEPKNIYIFKYYHPSSYLLARMLEQYAIERNLFGTKIFVGKGDGFFYKCCRYDNTAMPIVIVPSEIHESELNSYIKRGWFRKKVIENWGPVDSNLAFLKDKVNSIEKFDYDIGIYSSGEWARVDGLFRTDDIDGIKSMKYADNPLYKDFLNILDFLIEFSKSRSLKMKIYLHPYERNLIKEYNIYPPYLKLAEQEGIEFDYKEESSTKKIEEPFLGVSLQSSIIVERLMIGLIGFMKPLNINPKFFPKEYRIYFFENLRELEKKLLHFLEAKKIYR